MPKREQLKQPRDIRGDFISDLTNYRKVLVQQEEDTEVAKLGADMTKICVDFLKTPGKKSPHTPNSWSGTVPIELKPTDDRGIDLEGAESFPAEIYVSYSDSRRGVVVQLTPSSRAPSPPGFELPDEQLRLFQDKKPLIFNKRTESLLPATILQLQWWSKIVDMVKQHTKEQSTSPRPSS